MNIACHISQDSIRAKEKIKCSDVLAVVQICVNWVLNDVDAISTSPGATLSDIRLQLCYPFRFPILLLKYKALFKQKIFKL
jgi:hypothetical protein